MFNAFIFPDMNNKTTDNFTNTNVGGSKDPKRNLANTMVPVRQPRRKQDIVSWREAIFEMEQMPLPYRTKVQQILKDTYLDPHVFACLEKRYTLTLLRDFALVDQDGNPDEYWSKFLDKKWFRNIVRMIMDAQFYGYSLISLGDIVNNEFVNPIVIPRENISPDREVMMTIPGVPVGDKFLSEPWVDSHIWVPTMNPNGTSSCGFGLLYIVAELDIRLRNMMNDNSDYMQRFASPTMALYSDVSNEEERAEREQMLNTVTSMGWALLENGEELEMLNAGAGNGYKSYTDFEARLHKLMSKVILLHADAIDSTPGKLGSSQSGKESPSQSALYDVQQQDANFVEPVINEELLTRMRRFGINIPENLSFKFLNSEEENEIKQKQDQTNLINSQIIKNVIGSGFNIDPVWFEQTTGIKTVAAPVITEPDNGFATGS